MKTINLRAWLIRYLEANGVQCYFSDSLRTLINLYHAVTTAKKEVRKEVNK